MPKTIFLTSSLDLSYEDELGNKFAHKFTKLNKLQENFKKFIKKFDNFLYVASVEDNNENNDYYFNLAKQSFNLTLPFKNYYLLDGRTKHKAKELIEKADFIFLCGGHVPTQNKFFNNINLAELLKTYSGVICGASAGSMNCANTVYSAPELEGEASNKNFKRYLPGLNLTNINIIPHFKDVKNTYLDGKHFLNNILLPDSYNHKIYCYSDGAYILINNNTATIYGTSYLLENGNLKKISTKTHKIKE